ncbi:MAG: oligosaccharide flippase family protein [Bacteroidales bacterium]|nr:oligosaccharide flippase family protein [Bacteroidales bacterium]
MGIFRQLASQTLIYGFSTIIGRFLNYLLVPLYTNIFSPSEYGIITELYAYSSFLLIILTYGMETAFFRYSQKYDLIKVYSTALTSLILTSTIFVLLFFVFFFKIASILGYNGNENLLLLLVFILYTDTISSIAFALIRLQGKAKKFATLKLFNISVNILLNIIFYIILPLISQNVSNNFHFNISVKYVFISNLIANVFTVILLHKELLIKISFNFQLWREMITYAIPLLFAGLAGMVNETFDRAIIKHLIQDQNEALKQLGIYGANYKISILMTLFIQTFRFAIEPFFFSYSKNKDAPEMYAKIMKYFIISGLFIFLFVMLFIHYIQYFIGKEFREGLHIVPILLMANLFLGIYYNLSIWYKLTNKTIYGAIISSIGALITIVLNFTLVPLMGYKGAALATFICYLSITIISYTMGRKFYKIPYEIYDILFYFFITFIVYLTSCLLLPQTNNLTKNLFGITFLVIFIMICFFKEKKEIKQILKK